MTNFTMPLILAFIAVFSYVRAQDCKDSLPRVCPVTTDLCSDGEYGEVMYEVCRKACNFCGDRRAPTDPAILFLKLVTLVEKLVGDGKLNTGNNNGGGGGNAQQQIIYRPIAYPVPVNTTTCADKTGPNGVSNCAENRNLCQDATYKALMAEQCPATCGLCGNTSSNTVSNTAQNAQPAASSSSSGTCEDKTKDGKSDCAGNARLCNAPGYVNLMRDECPRTCGYCGVSGFFYYPYGYYYYGK